MVAGHGPDADSVKICTMQRWIRILPFIRRLRTFEWHLEQKCQTTNMRFYCGLQLTLTLLGVICQRL